VGDATGDVTEAALRRIQIREAIKAHFDKEQALFQQGVKVLTLFFIDEVAKYRDYARPTRRASTPASSKRNTTSTSTRCWTWTRRPTSSTSRASRREDPQRLLLHRQEDQALTLTRTVEKRGENAGLSDDVDAYDLILKDKERLLSFAEPVRFIFSHSALREGWDNPNVFVICALKHSDNTISRRQEVGRGLRLSVNQHGDRMDHPAIVHDVNVLTVVASESYKDFVAALQKDISDSLSARPKVADEGLLHRQGAEDGGWRCGGHAATGQADLQVPAQERLHRRCDRITDTYHEAKKAGTLASLPPS
jgi:type III restriction enzyme